MAYRHSKDMGEISGFAETGDPQGIAYEECCQDMLEAGVLWLKDNPGHELKIASFKDLYGIAIPQPGSKAEELSNAVLAAAKGEATGAMHHTIMERLYYINTNGWVKYCEELRKHAEEGG